MGRIAVVGANAEHPEVRVTLLELGDRRVVMLLSELIDRRFMADTAGDHGGFAGNLELRKERFGYQARDLPRVSARSGAGFLFAEEPQMTA